MNKNKIIYFIFLIIIALFTSIAYYSYAFFTHQIEEHGKLNIVAGTLDYQIESSHLTDHQITLQPNDVYTELTLKLTSLNKIDSKYELYYSLSDNSNIQIGYAKDSKDLPQGMIEKFGTKEVKILIINPSKKQVTITFGVHGGFSNLDFDDISKYGKAITKLEGRDVILAWNYTGEKENPMKFPSQEEGYRVESVKCNGIATKFDNITWELTLPKIGEEVMICNFELKDRITMTKDTELRVGDQVAGIDGSKWHVLESSKKETEMVTLLSDYNLNKDGSYNTSCYGQFREYRSGDFTCSTMPFDPDGTTTYDESDENNIGYFIKNTYAPLVTKNLPGTTNITLPEISQIMAVEGKTVQLYSQDISTPWLLTTNYWTKTEYPGTSIYAKSAYMVHGFYGFSRTSNVTDISIAYGARPVITTYKTNLLQN